MFRTICITIILTALLPSCASTSVSTTSTTLPDESSYDATADIKATLTDGRQLEIYVNDKLVLQQNLANKSAINKAAIFDKDNNYNIQCNMKEGFNFKDYTQCKLNYKKSLICTYDYWLKDTLLKKYNSTLTCGGNQDTTKQEPKRLYDRYDA